MKFLKISLWILGLLLISLLLMLWYSGAFTTLKVEEKNSDQYIVAGTLFTGAYYKVNTPMKHVDSLLQSIGIHTTQGFGIYYDDPKSTPMEKCRSFVGNVLDTNSFSKLAEIQHAGLTIDTIESLPSVIISLPTKTTLSYMIGPKRAYPALVKYITKKQLKPTLAVEIYDVPKTTTLFIMQVKK